MAFVSSQVAETVTHAHQEYLQVKSLDPNQAGQLWAQRSAAPDTQTDIEPRHSQG